MKFYRRKHLKEAVELNITAFMNLMVILVPFLLITAVFSRMTVLELNLPALDAAQQATEEKIKLHLQVVVSDQRFDIVDGNIGLIKSIDRSVQPNNWKEFSDLMLELKKRFPENEDISLLLAPGISYKTMIEVMDHVRSAQIVVLTSVETVELFPNISIGGAPEIQIIENSTPDAVDLGGVPVMSNSETTGVSE